MNGLGYIFLSLVVFWMIGIQFSMDGIDKSLKKLVAMEDKRWIEK
jgi:hypothetical protein